MRIVGNGFLAGHLAALAERHSDAVAVAAGVASTSVTDPGLFDRDAAMTYDVLRSCRPTDTVVYFSTASAAMYGDADSPGDEAGPVYPTSAYGRHKLAMEAAVAASGKRWLILRLSHLVGSRQPPFHLLPALSERVLSGMVTIYPGARRDLLDLRHLLVALDRLLTDGVHGQIVNVASGVPQPIELIVSGIEQRLGRSPRHELRDVVPASRTNPVSVAKLTALVPEVADFGFGAGYLDALLDRYLPEYAGVVEH
jgi:nucleoside-diphosphate-sugar epimerase